MFIRIQLKHQEDSYGGKSKCLKWKEQSEYIYLLIFLLLLLGLSPVLVLLEMSSLVELKVAKSLA